MSKFARSKPPARLPLLNAHSAIPTLRGGLALLTPDPASRDAEARERVLLYGRARWLAMRARVLREEPSCRACGAPTTVADHIHGHTGVDWRERFHDRASIQGLCASCHSSKTATTEQHGAGGQRKAPSGLPPPPVKGWDGSC